jgi:hypothetical protein
MEVGQVGQVERLVEDFVEREWVVLLVLRTVKGVSSASIQRTNLMNFRCN